MPIGPESQLLGILAALVDPTLNPSTDKGVSPQRALDRSFAQLPWMVRGALGKLTWDHAPELLKGAPQDRYGHVSMPDATPDLLNAAPYYSGPSRLLQIGFSDAFRDQLNNQAAQAPRAETSSEVEIWFQKHGLSRPPDPDSDDPHWGERAFILNVFVKAYGLAALDYVEPQARFANLPYAVDFAIRSQDKTFLIEVDGRDYHAPERIGEERFEHELERQNKLMRLGFPLLRFPVRRILSEAASIIRELRQHLPSLGTGQSQLFEQTSPAQNQTAVTFARLIRDYCDWFRPLQTSLLLALFNRRAAGRIVIEDREAPPALLALVLQDLSDLVQHVQQLYGISLGLPEVTLLCHASPGAADLVGAYRQLRADGPDLQTTEGAFRIAELVPDPAADSLSPDVVVDVSVEGRMPVNPDGGGPDLIGRESLAIATLRNRYSNLAGTITDRTSLRPKEYGKRLVDYFARRVLGIPCLYHYHDPERPKKQERQYELVKRILEGKSTFGIMPTGRGKSVAFQLPAKLLAGSVLVISPLRALMRDQIDDLHYSRGYNSADSISYDQRPDQREDAIEEFLAGRTKLLYVSPERLQELKFSTRLAAAAARVHVSFLAIDEAHCVSEWGHDFRLSYMKIPRFVDAFRRMQDNIECPIVALTATASPPVQRDVCSILGLQLADIREGGHIGAEANIDRTELSLSVHEVQGDSYPGDRRKAFTKVVSKVLPTALHENHAFDWSKFATGHWRGKASGVVFCLYKDPRGQTGWCDGVGSVRDYLVSQELIPSKEVRIYAADAPAFCPECTKLGRENYSLRTLPKKKPTNGEAEESTTSTEPNYVCSEGHQLIQAAYDKNWQTYLPETQHTFKSNGFPLLVTTKAYGMGIDHRGLRFVIHYGMSASLESYYQEVGRAGRDGNHAHCALLVRLPETSCFEKYILNPSSSDIYTSKDDSEFLPPCLTTKYRKSRRCPPEIGLPEPCDLSRQLVMTMESYVQPERFAEKCILTWTQLTQRQPSASGARLLKVKGGGMNGAKKLQAKQNHLFRLQQLGLVRDFMLEYARRGFHFDVIFHVWMQSGVTIGTVRKALTERLNDIYSAGDRPQDSASSERGWLTAYSEVKGEEDKAITAAPLRTAIELLFRAIRGHVIRMRMASFSKLLEYAKSRESCRRKVLLGGMTAQMHGEDNYSCGFCDSSECQPDWRFKTKRARPAPESGQFSDIFAAEQSSFKSQNIDHLVGAIREAKNRGVLEAVGHIATAQVEHDPDNAAANLAAAVAHSHSKDPNLRQFANRYFKQFATVANNRKDEAAARQGYEWFKEYKPSDAIRTFAVPGGAFDTKDGLSKLAADAKAVDLSEAEKAHLALAAYQVTKTATSDRLKPLKDVVEDFFK